MRRQHAVILFVLVALGGGTLWLLFGHERIEEGRCRLAWREVPSNSQLTGLAIQILQPLTAKPEGVRDLPAGFDRPCYYEINSGSRRIPLVLSLSERPRLCLDADGDGELSQERSWGATLIREGKDFGNTWRFGPISPISQDSSGEAESGFYVDCFQVSAPAPLFTRPVSFKTGKLRLAGRTYRVAVADGDCDGQFRSLLSLPLDQAWRFPASDVFALDRTGDRKFEFSLVGQSEVMPLGHWILVADTYYAVDIAADGTSLTLTPAQPEFGTLAIEPNDATVGLRLWSDASDQCLQGRRWQLPAGKYKAIRATLEKKDASGDVWSFSSSLSSAFTRLGTLEFFEIRPGETTAIRIGSPFTVKADVRKMSAGMVSIDAVLVGCAGEQYQAGVQRNSRRALEPSFKILDEGGGVLVADKFQYG